MTTAQKALLEDLLRYEGQLETRHLEAIRAALAEIIALRFDLKLKAEIIEQKEEALRRVRQAIHNWREGAAIT